jgi:hypothetical protein
MTETKHNASWGFLATLIVASVASLLLISTLFDFAWSAQDEAPLSGDGNLAAEPRADMSDDGAYLVAVWVEGEETASYRGDVKLRRAIWDDGTSTYVWDASPVTVFEATDEGYYLYADVDIQDNVVHVAAAFQFNTVVRIVYQKYNLPSLTPSFGEGQSTFLNPSADYTLAGVQVAASQDPNQPYITFARNDGEIYYLRWNTSNTNPLNPSIVSTDDAYKPQMAYVTGTDDNYIHFIWEKRLEAEGTGYPLYRRCQESTGACSDPVKLEDQETIGYTYPSPFLAAQGERLIAGWQRCASGGGTGTDCKKFRMIYTLSDDAGQNLIDLGPNTYPDVAGIGDPEGYAGTDAPSKVYRARLQPSLTLNAEGLPYVAWQVATDTENERHAIHASIAVSETATGFIWEEPPGLEIGSDFRDRVKPFVIVPHSEKEPGRPDLRGLHLFYMYGRVSSEPGYEVYYTYLEEIDPNATPTFTSVPGEPTSTGDPGEPTPTEGPTPTVDPNNPDDGNDVFLPLIMRVAG